MISPLRSHRDAWTSCTRIALSITLSAPLACSGESASSTTASVVRDSSGVISTEHDLMQLAGTCAIDPTPTLSIGVEEGDEVYMLSDVSGAARLSDGRIVIAQRSTHDIRYYDSTGTFLRTSGRQGRGPGEFSSPYHVHVRPGDTVYVGDYEPFQFLVFAPDGSWLRTVRPTPLNSPRTVNVLASGALMLGQENRGAPDPTAFAERSLTLERYNAEGTLRDTVGDVAMGRYGQINPAPGAIWTFPLFESFGQMYARGDRIVTGHASEPELRMRRDDDAMTLDRIIRWNAGLRDISAGDIAAERARVAKQYENFDVAERFPAFGTLMIGADDRIWIREFPRPADTTAHHWIAFSRDGQFHCRLDTPRFSEYYEFGDDYVLVKDPDSLGVDRVRQFVIRVP